jgi:membrane-associated phospholipid phosphatase
MIIKSNKILITIFISSLIVYILSCIGLFDNLSAFGVKYLYNALGYTNKWSKTYGSPWFNRMTGDISALGSRELVLFFSIFIYFYLYMVRDKIYANKFLFTIGFGILLILIVKFTTSKLDEFTLNSVLTESLSNFPSGHAFIVTVMYLAMAQYLSSRKKSYQVNKYLFISASIVIILVGICRFLGAGHTITEVIAGWSLGLCWFTFVQLFLRLDHKSIFNK